MRLSLSRAVMALATAAMLGHRPGWALAMQAEYDAAAEDKQALSFALGCLVAACRETVRDPRGRFVLTSYAVALGIMIPMAGLQIGCAVFGLPYLYPGMRGLSGAMLVGGAHQALLRSVYLDAIPALALIQLLTGVGHLRLAWLLVEQDWSGAFRWATWTLAAMTTLVIFMGVLFLDSRQALIQAGIVAIELSILMAVTRRHQALGPLFEPPC